MQQTLNAILLALCATTLFACGTAQPIGVREPFRGARVAHISVADFYATSSFGLSPDEFDARLLAYEAATIAWLESAGIQVTPPEDLRQRLEERSLGQAFGDGVVLNRPLDELFEPGDDRFPLESQTVKSIAGRGGFPSNVLLFAEVVYQTVGTCDGEVSEYNSRAIVLEPIGGAQPPTPCVVSHLNAKLVDTASGATMWHNRLLVEQWFTQGKAVEVIIDQTIVTVVDLALDRTGGIRQLLQSVNDPP